MLTDAINRALDEQQHFREREAGLYTRELHDQYAKEVNAHIELLVNALQTRIDQMEALADRREGALSSWRWAVGFLGLSGVVGILIGLIAVFEPR